MEAIDHLIFSSALKDERKLLKPNYIFSVLVKIIFITC